MFEIDTRESLSPEEIAAVKQEVLDSLRNKDKAEVDHVIVERDPETGDLLVKIRWKNYIRRTRRITGYLADVDRFNIAKLAELRDRRPQT